MTVLVSLLVLGVLVFMHELGHFIAAKRAGVHVHELAFGMGPRLGGFQRGETTYSLRMLPFGGFVRMASVADPVVDDAPPVAPERAFESKRLLSRVGVIGAGPVMNFILSILLIFLVFGLLGFDQAVPNSTVIGEIVAGAPASVAGLQPGDRIVSVDGREVSDWQSMVDIIKASLGLRLEIVFERAGERMTTQLTPTAHPQDGKIGYVGIAAQTVKVRLPLARALTTALSETWRMCGLWVTAIAGMLRGKGVADVTGPVGIVQMIGEASRFGLVNVLYLAAVISANFGLMNLLPIPALDGGRLVFFALEGLRGKPVPPEQEGRVHLIGYGLLMALLVLLTYRDLARIISGGR